MSGILINGSSYPVDGVTIVNQRDAAWAHLDAGDGMARSVHPQFQILHKTKADDPEKVVQGDSPKGRAERVADFWASDPQHSGAHVVVGADYTACLADLVTFMAYHARAANYLGIGIEHYEEAGGVVYEQTLRNGVAIEREICLRCGIQYQVPKLPYTRHLSRFANGGRDLVGLFGHRDVDDTRNRWDPGDTIFAMHIQAGAETFDFEAGEDLHTWKERQVWLVSRGHALVVDGIPGPHTTAALLAEGYRGGIWAFGKS